MATLGYKNSSEKFYCKDTILIHQITFSNKVTEEFDENCTFQKNFLFTPVTETEYYSTWILVKEENEIIIIIVSISISIHNS